MANKCDYLERIKKVMIVLIAVLDVSYRKPQPNRPTRVPFNASAGELHNTEILGSELPELTIRGCADGR